MTVPGFISTLKFFEVWLGVSYKQFYLSGGCFKHIKNEELANKGNQFGKMRQGNGMKLVRSLMLTCYTPFGMVITLCGVHIVLEFIILGDLLYY